MKKTCGSLILRNLKKHKLNLKKIGRKLTLQQIKRMSGNNAK